MAALSTTALVSLTAASTLSQFAGQRGSARAAQALAGYEAALLEQNATVADAQARDAMLRGAEAEARHRGDVTRFAGAQRARLAAQGIELGSGSAREVALETATLGELDALTLRNNARREAWGFEVQGMDLRSQAALVRAGGSAQAASYRAQSMGTLLTGGAQIGGFAYERGWGRRTPRAEG